MYSYCYELLENIDRGLNENRAFFLGPTCKGRIADALSDWNAEILMIRNKPVARAGLFEIRALNRDELWRNECR
jgi:hypothetical protein